jgi:hypothetical protein
MPDSNMSERLARHAHPDPDALTQNWIAVASAEHVRRGRADGFMQVCHGKGGPLARIRAGALVAYYSPTVAFHGVEKCQAFTSFGIVRATPPYQVDMGGGFRPFRRDVTWLETHDAPIRPLLADLEFAAGRRNWGYQLRLGLFSVSDRDMLRIAAAMGADKVPV